MVAGTLTEAQKALVVANMKIVDWHVYTNFTANPTIAGFAQEDLRQTGYLALCIAALHYNGTVEFETFAQVVVRNCLAEYCSKILPEGRHLSLDVQLETEKDTYCPYDVLSAADSQNAFLTFESQELIARSKEKYSGIIRKGIEAMELRMQGFTGPEIAEMYGCKANEVTAWIARARQRLRADRHFIAAVS